VRPERAGCVFSTNGGSDPTDYGEIEMRRKLTTRGALLALALPALLLSACTVDDSWYVPVVDDNPLADGFDFPVEPGEMDGWTEPPEADETWDPSSYLVHREDGIHAAIDFMREDGSSSQGYEIWSIADGVVVDIVWDREAYPDRHDGGDRDEDWGNIMLIQHDYEVDGVRKQVWSQYAHTETVEIELGDVIQRGQRIGLVGKTDGVEGSESWSEHLHFETRTSALKAEAWPKTLGFTTDSQVEEHYTHPLEFIRANRPTS
jgi:murein DD-endopeptidase MepM/ murein hydrolase activator NlpD